MEEERRSRVDLKIVLLGSAAVGKTSLVHRYVHNEFTNTTATIGAAFALKQWKSFKLGIWDTAGQEKYAKISAFYCRGAGAGIVCFDPTEEESFANMPKYVQNLQEGAEKDCLIVICATKQDLLSDNLQQRKVSREQAKQYADELNGFYFETSAKTGLNVTEVFDRIGYHLFAERLAMNPSSSNDASADSLQQSSSSEQHGSVRPSPSSPGTIRLEETPESRKSSGGSPSPAEQKKSECCAN